MLSVESLNHLNRGPRTASQRQQTDVIALEQPIHDASVSQAIERVLRARPESPLLEVLVDGGRHSWNQPQGVERVER